MEPILVTSYHFPDTDGTACSIAYAELLNLQGRPAIAALYGIPHPEARYVLERLGLAVPALPVPHAAVALMDMSQFDGLHESIVAADIVEVVDHRQDYRAEDFPNAIMQVEMVGAAATLIEERWLAAGLQPMRTTAQLLQAAIASNTIHFTAEVTTSRDHDSFARLAAQASLPDGFIHDMFAAKSDLSGPLLGESLHSDAYTFLAGGISICYYQLEIVGAEALVSGRWDEMREVMQGGIEAGAYGQALLAILDVEEGHTLLIPCGDQVAALLETVTGARLQHGMIRLDRLLLRKRLRPLLQAR